MLPNRNKKKTDSVVHTTESVPITPENGAIGAWPLPSGGGGVVVYQIVFLKNVNDFRGDRKGRGDVVNDATESETENLLQTDHIKILSERKVKK